MSDTRLQWETERLVAGRLEGMSVPDLMWLLCRRCVTGTLRLERRGIEKRVYFQEGRIVFAASTDPNDRLGELLLREGLIRLDQFEDAISRRGQGKRLGAVLVESGYLKAEDLVAAVTSQCREIVIGLFPWEDGEYRFEEGPLPNQEVVTLGVRTGEILLQGIRRIQSFSRIRRSVGGPRTRYRVATEAAEFTEGLTLNEAERLVIQRLQSGPGSVETLCREIYASNFEIHQALWALKVLGAVCEADGAPRVPSGAFAVEGTLPANGVVEILIRLCRAGETGVLHVTRGSQERSFHVKEGRCIFATSNEIDDGLIAFLLRRGVISLRDREETARRLLSNKRVGTILLEMGVLDEKDLREMVRQQLGEIVYDTFRWEDGEYAFVSGELPTIEEIVMEASLEDLVSEGLRRVTQWSRVQAGCGADHDGYVGLTPDFLSVLDRMRVGADEWEVVSGLGEPRRIHEVCRATKLGDFRVCQILWALRLLGAVRDVPAEEVEAWAARAAAASVEGDPAPIPVAEPAREEPVVMGAFDGAEPASTDAVPAPAWLADLRGENAPLSPSPEPSGGEVISEPWRLVAEAFPPPAWLSETHGVAGGESPAAEEPSAESGTAEAVPRLDSPGDATRFLPRDEIEAALGLGPRPGSGEQYELGEPGSGAEEDPVPGVGADEPSAEYELAAAGTHLEPEPDPEPCEARDSDETAEETAEEMAGPVQVEPPDDPPRATEDAAVREEPAFPEPPAAASFERAEPETALPAAEAPEHLLDLDLAIRRFNQRHRVLYRAIRSEIGAGAANFIRSCRGGLGEKFDELFAESRLLPDGTWDADGLKRIAREKGVQEPWLGLERLLDREFEMLRPQIGESRGKALRDQLLEVTR